MRIPCGKAVRGVSGRRQRVVPLRRPLRSDPERFLERRDQNDPPFVDRAHQDGYYRSPLYSVTDIDMPIRRNPRDLLTPAALHILLSLAQDDLHGYAIKHAVEDRTDGRMSLGPGTLYEAVHRMAADGWIAEVQGGGRRRVYRITRTGRHVLDDELQRLEQIVAYARGADLLPRTT